MYISKDSPKSESVPIYILSWETKFVFPSILLELSGGLLELRFPQKKNT